MEFNKVNEAGDAYKYPSGMNHVVHTSASEETKMPEPENVNAAITELIGETEEKISKRRVDWVKDVFNNVVRKGVIIDLHIGRSRFERKITKEDLGLDIPDEEFQKFVDEYFYFGKKILIPKTWKNKFDRVEGRARRNLESHAFQTPWGFFVPCTAYKDYKEKRAEIEQEYVRAKEELKGCLEQCNEETLREYRQAAATLYERSFRSKPLERFTEEFIENVRGQLPTRDLIDNTFYFEEDIFYIPLPSEIEEERLKAEVLERERKLEEAKTQAGLQIIRDEVQMHRDAVKHLIEKKEAKLDGLIDTVSKDLKGAIYATLKDVLEGIKNRASLSGGSVKSIKKLVERTRMMNFTGDEDIESALGKIEEVVNVKSSERDMGDMASTFRDIAAEFRAYALEEDELPDIGERGLLL